MNGFEKQKQIQRIAEEDFSYTVWRSIFEESEKPFAHYADNQTEEIRAVLWSYAYACRMMNQRLLNLACEHMEFPYREC